MAKQSDWLSGAIKQAGGKAKFADAVGMTRSHLSHVLAGKRRFPARLALAVEEAFGVPRHVIAPDFFKASDAQTGGKS